MRKLGMNKALCEGQNPEPFLYFFLNWHNAFIEVDCLLVTTSLGKHLYT